MKYSPFILVVLIFNSCGTIQDCGALKFDETERLTYNESKLFTGICQSYYYSGKIRSKEEYINGKDHGKWTFFFRNGSVQTTGKFNKGVKIGKWEYFYENGNIWKINFFDSDGDKTGEWIEYNEKGELIEKKGF